jgi:RNA polymerase sigma-70 factor (ECF subfamily)
LVPAISPVSVTVVTGVDLEATAARAAAGDGIAFAALVRATQGDVRRACAALVDADSADDLAQETYLRAHRALPTYTGAAPVRMWLLGIARNVCRNEVRGRARRRRVYRRLGSAVAVAVSPSPAGAIDLWQCVEALPIERREAFVLTQLLGFSYDEAAETCGCPTGTIRSRVARARDDLRAMLSVGEGGRHDAAAT